MAWFVIGLAACNAIAGLDGDFTGPDAGGTSPGTSSGGSTGTAGSSSGSSTSSTGGQGTSASSTSSGGTTTSSGGTTTSSSSTTSSSGTVDAGDAGKDTRTPPFCFTDNTWDFCWNFNGDDPPDLYGASARYATGGDPVVELLNGGPEGKGLHVINSVPTSASKSTAFIFQRNNYPTAKKTLNLTFQFRVLHADTYAVIGALQIDGFEHGIAMTNVGCPGGGSCIFENQPDPPRSTDTARIPVDGSWHTGEVTLTWPGGSGPWKGTTRVDGTLLKDRNDAIPSTSQSSTYQVILGAFYSGAGGAGRTDEVEIDNMRVDLP